MNNSQKRERHPFTPEEDKKLRELVNRFGEKNWSIISGLMMNRTVRQCRDRWTNSLCGNVVKGEWTAEEDSLLLQLFKEYGSRWKSMEKFFPGRAQYDIRNHCKSIVRQKLYAINFLNQKRSASSNSKNNFISTLQNTKLNQSLIPSPLRTPSHDNQNSLQKVIPNPELNITASDFIVNDANIQNSLDVLSDRSFNESFINEKLLMNNSPDLQNSTEKRNGISFLDNSVNELVKGKSFIDLQKIDPILVPFISKPMLLGIPSTL